MSGHVTDVLFIVTRNVLLVFVYRVSYLCVYRHRVIVLDRE